MILEPEEYQRAEQEFHTLHSGPYKDEDVNQWILFSLFVKEGRQQNTLLQALLDKLNREPQEYIDKQTGTRLIVEYDIPNHPRITAIPPEEGASYEEVNEATRRLMRIASLVREQ